jgi:NAD(P)-dependent dehydrogenase (short-subunit alcohol dehydrogenase family)
LVTGASSGIGLAVAAALADLGFDLTVVGRDRGRLDDAVASLSEPGRRIRPVAADMGEPVAAERIVAAHREQFGGLDCVVANAGGSRRAPVAGTDPESLRRLLAVHVESAFSLARHALPLLRRRPGAGPSWFIVMSSVAALIPPPEFAAYSAVKSALVSLAQSINREEGGNGVRACALCPAFVDTRLTAPLRPTLSPDEMLRPDDVAGSVRFLLSLSANEVVNQIVIERVGAPPLQP